MTSDRNISASVTPLQSDHKAPTHECKLNPFICQWRGWAPKWGMIRGWPVGWSAGTRLSSRRCAVDRQQNSAGPWAGVCIKAGQPQGPSS